MAGKGGSAPRRKGDASEVVKDQQSLGRLAYRVRQAQGAIVDVVSLESCQDAACTVNGRRVGQCRLIQCRSDGPRLSAKEREQLRAEADRASGIPMLAWPENGTIQYEQLEEQT